MGRFEKNVWNDSGIDRRELGYYSTPNFVSDFMVDTMMKINPTGKSVLDPCVGKEELIKGLYDRGLEIDGIDIFNHGDYFYCNFTEGDFIEKYEQNKPLLDQNIKLKYDYYIANPPYNCHEVDFIRNNKKKLSALFRNIGVYNMYSMFISAMIDSAKEGALISLISADSFLTATLHNPLRKQILNECTIHYLVLCPTDLFWDQKADVRTCILILQKGKKYQSKVRTLNRPKDKEDFEQKLLQKNFTEVDLDSLINTSGKDSFEFVIDIPSQIQSLFQYPRIGDLYKCITGISTGADANYISRNKKVGFEVPFYKNPGSRKFYCEPDGYLTNDYLEHDKNIRNFMVRNKSYMLKEGITCSSMGLPFGACYLPKGSTYGVNANIFCETKDIWWLLSYLNSSLVTYFVRGVLIRSNMITSGYVSKIPVIPFSERVKARLQEISKLAYNNKTLRTEISFFIHQIDEIIFGTMNLSKELEEDIIHFASNLQSRV